MLRPILYLLAGLSIPDFEWLLRMGKKKGVAAGQVLIHEGKEPSALYILLKGEMVISSETVLQQEIARAVKGDVIGEISFVDARPASATVTAITDAQLWAIPRPELLVKLNGDTSFAAHFYEALAILLADRLRVATVRLPDGSPAETLPGLNPDMIHPKFKDSIKTAQLRLQWMLENL